jgi:hypothetical protein
MSCKYKDSCPSYSGWCEGPHQDFESCIPFLITAYENAANELDRYENMMERGMDSEGKNRKTGNRL